MPDLTNWWRDPNFKGGISGGSTSTSSTTPAYERISSIPAWLPGLNTGELSQQYRDLGKSFDTSPYDVASKSQESRVLTTALNAGNNAATEYANRARQSGSSGLGAGLVKAEAGVGAQKSAGEIALQRAQFDASQREKAAGLASQIASTLGNLRDSYLKSIVDYATKEDSISAEYKAKMAAIDSTNRNSTTNKSWTATIPNSMGLASGLNTSASNVGTGQFLTPPSANTPLASWNYGGGG